MLTILLLSSNPSDMPALRTDKEYREIEENIKKSKYSEQINIVLKCAVKKRDLLQSINECDPDIIHFSGHSKPHGIMLEGDDGKASLVPKSAIIRLINLCKNLKLVVFNACDSFLFAKEAVEKIDFAIGMNNTVNDNTAIVFAYRLYSSLCFGKSIEEAFEQAKAEVDIYGYKGVETPQLFAKKGINKGVPLVVGKRYDDVSKYNIDTKIVNSNELEFSKINEDKMIEVTNQSVDNGNTDLYGLKVGDDILFGKYCGESILWECVKEDENGVLLVSKYILCLKVFDAAESGIYGQGKYDYQKYGSNKWENSNIRDWLNSAKQNVEYQTQPPIKDAVCNEYSGYANEPGFLVEFSREEIDNIKEVKHGYAVDKVFLLSKNEIESLWQTKKKRIRCVTESLLKSGEYKFNRKSWMYWTRTQLEFSAVISVDVSYDGTFCCYSTASEGINGILPALYLKKLCIGNYLETEVDEKVMV